jgi:NADPH-dependent 2,4-dienoyl-CoA reductase/sulfur reductase-like enzyme
VVKKFITNESHLEVVLDNGKQIECDFAILCAGVKTEFGAGPECWFGAGYSWHIVADGYLTTSDPDIFAAGDAVEVRDPILGGRTAIPLAGPANKQGRLVADNIMGARNRYWGSMGAFILKAGN